MSTKSGREWKIGLVVVIAIVLLILGLRFLIGENVFTSENKYYTYYDNVQGLQESAIVQVSGMSVGRVAAIDLQPDKRVRVAFTTSKDLKIPKGSVAQLSAADLISGTKIISLKLSDSNAYYVDGDMIPPKGFSGLLDNISENVSPLLTSVQHAVVTLDTLISSVNNLFNTKTQQHLSNSMASMDEALAQLSELSENLNQQSRNLAGVIENTHRITSNIADNNNHISQTLTNLDNFTRQLSQSNLDQTLASLQQTSENLKEISTKINSSEGSLGMMLNDKHLYMNLSETLSSLDILLNDLKQHPAKYINVSVFGRKAK